MAHLTDLPTELLYLILYHIPKSRVCKRSRDIAKVALVNRRLYKVFEPEFYRKRREEPGCYDWLRRAVESDFPNVVSKLLSAGANPNQYVARDDRVYRQCDDLFSSNEPFQGLRFTRWLWASDWGVSWSLRKGYGKDKWRGDRAEYQGKSSQDQHDEKHPFSHLEQSKSQHGHRPTHTSWRLLHLASALGFSDIVDVLLDHGADTKSPGTGVCGCDFLSLINDFVVGSTPGADSTITSWSPFHIAICKRRYQCARLLAVRGGLSHYLDDTEDPAQHQPTQDQSEAIDATPLYHIVARCDSSPERLDALYQIFQDSEAANKLNVDTFDQFMHTPLAVAAYHGNLKSLGPWFIAHGADPNAVVHLRGTEDVTSLFLFLCYMGRYDDAALLMDMGASVVGKMTIRPGFDEDSLHVPLGMMELGTSKEPLQLSALQLCCSLHGKEHSSVRSETLQTEMDACNLLLRLLNEKGLDVNSRDADGRTPLMYAVNCGSTEVVRVLLSANADVNAVDNFGASVLYCVCGDNLKPYSIGHLRILHDLLDAGAKLHADYRGRTELFELCIPQQVSPILSYSTAMLGLLHTYGADFNARNDEGASPLMFAFLQGALDVVDYLLCLRVTVTVRDCYEMAYSLLERCYMPRQLEMMHSLQKVLHRAQPTQRPGSDEWKERTDFMWPKVLFHAVKRRRFDLVTLFLEQGVKPCYRSVSGDSVLHLSVKRTDKFCLTMLSNLIHYGAHEMVNEVNDRELSPLQMAVAYRNAQVAYVLAEGGANIHQATAGAPAPLATALRMYYDQRHYKVLRSLLDPAHRMWSEQDSSLWKGQHYIHKLVEALISAPKSIQNSHYRDDSLSKKTFNSALTLLGYGVDVNDVDDEGDSALSTLLQFLLDCAITGRTAEPEAQETEDTLAAPAVSLASRATKPAATRSIGQQTRISVKESAILHLFTLLVSQGADLSLQGRDGVTAVEKLREIASLGDVSACDVPETIDTLRACVKIPPYDTETRRMLGRARARYPTGEPVLFVFNDMDTEFRPIQKAHLDDPENWVPIWSRSTE